MREGGRRAERPALSTLSGEDFYALTKAGYRPAGIVVGNCTYQAYPSRQTRVATGGNAGPIAGTGGALGLVGGVAVGTVFGGPPGLIFGGFAGAMAGSAVGTIVAAVTGLSSVWQNQELPDLTQALYNARALAMSRMETEATGLGATGIVSVALHVDAHPQGEHEQPIGLIYHFTAIGTAITRISAPAKLEVKTIIPLSGRGLARARQTELDAIGAAATEEVAVDDHDSDNDEGE